jgi:hypothetical protein
MLCQAADGVDAVAVLLAASREIGQAGLQHIDRCFHLHDALRHVAGPGCRDGRGHALAHKASEDATAAAGRRTTTATTTAACIWGR